jgi:amidase
MKYLLTGLLLMISTFLSAVDANINYYSAKEIASKIRSKQVTSVEVVTSVLDQISKYNAEYNAIVTLNPTALEEARNADKLIAQGDIKGPLHGVPIVVKDSYKVEGLRTTSGYVPLKDFIPNEDSVVVSLLKESGAIIIGKGNMPTLAMDMQTDNPIFGRTNNPWDTDRTPGGSSGGDSVAVASGFSYLGFGSDLAGSLRVPSAFTGIYGLKTTYGVVSKTGHIPPLPDEINGLHSMAVMGPLARTIEDLELALGIIAQPHRMDQSVIPLVPLSENDLSVTITDMNIAWMDNFGGVPVSEEIKEKLKDFVLKLEEAGAKVTKIEPDQINYEEIWETWGSFVGHQGGYDKSNPVRNMGDFFTKSVTKNIPMHRKIVGGISVPQYMELLNIQQKTITIMENFLDEYDVWITPVCSTTAFKHIEPSRQFGDLNVYRTPVLVDGNKVEYYVATQSYTTVFAVTENPVLSMPVGLDSDGLPVGVQIVGKRYYDYRLLHHGKILSQFTDEIVYPLQNQ